jgi:hypothetical protein
MHVGDLDGTARAMGKNWEASVTIAVHDQDHNPACDAIVSGLWSGGYVGSVSCTTDGTGTCSVTSAKMKNATSATFTVTDLTRYAFTYQPSDNHDADGDSDGTQITVSRP